MPFKIDLEAGGGQALAESPAKKARRLAAEAAVNQSESNESVAASGAAANAARKAAAKKAFAKRQSAERTAAHGQEVTRAANDTNGVRWQK